ncbi:protein-(glutamine-N5) methyltransferase, release factor-specific [Pseudodesulfovibrio mercurii]|uniref:Release factor glutamine methyltransferase n=1 Tax=Pseudodesulfovibrio mercurii TaxID=641491 RepID=F0JGL6_9BACT|nr:peptide chain release factor N(5)-glutamine methyltransferase [Pseudodesulfovibrio mercurii]EGB13885.1 protein-(glutamine-N5) methyltransferase, release factor-specific [Pseudodesulfovibrio mercurii]
MPRNIQDVLKRCESRLSGVDSPRLSAELLAAHALGCSRPALNLDRGRVLTDEELAAVETLVARREAGEPVAYILGNREFYGLDFAVSPAVLIPRPETEHIVEAVEERFSKDQPFRFADLGTGSGILAVTIAVLFPQARGVAVDISPDALDVARANARTHNVADRLDFLQADFTSQTPEGPYDLVVSNPPYVTEAEFEAASREVTGFEPTGALVSGPDGLDHIRAMLPRVADMLRPGGWMFMEIGWEQGCAVMNILAGEYPSFEAVGVRKDLAGLDRVVCARRN